MNEQQLASIERKNAWLHDLVEVEFPTPESLKGRETYFQAINAQEYQIVAKASLLEGEANLQADDIFLVDFHRLTIMFSILQSQRWEEQYDQEMIVEYLTQIILRRILSCTLVLKMATRWVQPLRVAMKVTR